MIQSEVIVMFMEAVASFTFSKFSLTSNKINSNLNTSVDVRINDEIYLINCYYHPPNTENLDLFLEETERILSNLDDHNAKTKLKPMRPNTTN